MHEISEQRNIQYNLHSETDFKLGSAKAVKCGLRDSDIFRTLEQFKMKTKYRKPTHCPCNLCRPYFNCLEYKYM